MTAIAAVVAPFQIEELDRLVRQAIQYSRERGSEAVHVETADGSAVGVGAFEWERQPGRGGSLGFARSETIMVAADASIYYHDDLQRKITREKAGNEPVDSATLILRAYQEWGPSCPRHLEGDFAFVLWDRSNRRLLAARDFGGTRPLFFSSSSDGLWVASTIEALTHVEDIDLGYNVLSLAEDAASLTSMMVDETCYQAIRRIPAGWSLVARVNEDPRLEPHWERPLFGSGPHRGSLESSAEELRAILVGAVETRIVGVERPAVWMSGGYDSTAVFSAGSSRGATITPVSIRYPQDDPGYEDPWIEAAAARWDAEVRWVDMESIPPLDRPLERAARRDEPFAHKFEMWNRALCRRSLEAGSTTALGGNGGDQLFNLSPAYLGDLLFRGNWIRLRHEWRSGFRGAGHRFFFRWAIQPRLSPPLLELAKGMRGGRPLIHYMEDRPPPWFRDDFVRQSGLGDRIATRIERRAGELVSSVETGWYFRAGFGAKVNALVNSLGLSEGIELRSPLYDARLVQFVASLPLHWRTGGGESKVILRRAMSGLVPETVLKPRQHRTGLPRGYLARCLRQALPNMAQVAGDCEGLADLGIIEPGTLANRYREYLADPAKNGSFGGPVYDTLATELWLRSHT